MYLNSILYILWLVSYYYYVYTMTDTVTVTAVTRFAVACAGTALTRGGGVRSVSHQYSPPPTISRLRFSILDFENIIIFLNKKKTKKKTIGKLIPIVFFDFYFIGLSLNSIPSAAHVNGKTSTYSYGNIS